MIHPRHPTLDRTFSAQALGLARLDAARRANDARGRDPDLHARLTAAQTVLLAAQGALHPLLR